MLAQWLGTARRDHSPLDAIIAELNEKHAVVCVGGSVCILNELIDPITHYLRINLSRAGDFSVYPLVRNPIRLTAQMTCWDLQINGDSRNLPYSQFEIAARAEDWSGH